MKRLTTLKRPLTAGQAQLAANYFPLAVKMAGDRWRQLPHSISARVSRDDLTGPACLALAQAARRYDPRRHTAGAFFRARIFGAISDYLRSLDGYSRPARARARAGLLPPGFEVSQIAAARTPAPDPFP